jgi:hypothetical protein
MCYDAGRKGGGTEQEGGKEGAHYCYGAYSGMAGKGTMKLFWPLPEGSGMI